MAERPPQLSEILTKAGIAAWSIVGMVALSWVVLEVLGRMEALLAPVTLAVALIYVLNPVVNRVSLRGRHRLVGSVIAFALLLGLVVLLGFLVSPAVRTQATGFTGDFPSIYEDAVVQVEDLAETIGFSVDLWSYEKIQGFVNDPDNRDQFIAAAWDRLGAVTTGLLEAILVFFVAPVVAFYTLIDLPRIRREAVELIPEMHRAEVVYVARELGVAVGGFLRGQLFVALIVGSLTSFGFWLIGLDFWLIIGMIAGLLNIIPFVGPWVGGTLGVMVGLVTGSATTALWALVVAAGVQQLDNHIISPTVMRATVRLHPAVVILVLILGGALGGLWGVLLAVPTAASVKIVLGHLWRTRVLGQSWDEAAQALVEVEALPSRLHTLRERRRPAAETDHDPVGAVAADPPPTEP